MLVCFDSWQQISTSSRALWPEFHCSFHCICLACQLALKACVNHCVYYEMAKNHCTGEANLLHNPSLPSLPSLLCPLQISPRLSRSTVRFVTRQTWKKTTEPTSQISFASEAIEFNRTFGNEMSCMALYASAISSAQIAVLHLSEACSS